MWEKVGHTSNQAWLLSQIMHWQGSEALENSLMMAHFGQIVPNQSFQKFLQASEELQFEKPRSFWATAHFESFDPQFACSGSVL